MAVVLTVVLIPDSFHQAYKAKPLPESPPPSEEKLLLREFPEKGEEASE